MANDLLPIPLGEIFTAAGAAVWGAALAGVVQVLKNAVPFIPSTGRGVLYTVMILAAGLLGLAVYDLQPAITGETIIGFVLTWVAIVTTASGSFEIASKGVRMVQGTTDPTGPDTPGEPVGPITG